MIGSQPVNVDVERGGNATLSVVATGEGLSYQWFGPDGGPLSDSDGAIEGATTPTLRITNAGPDDSGDYRVRITTASGGIVDSDSVSLSVGELFCLCACMHGGHVHASCFTCLVFVQVLQLTHNQAMSMRKQVELPHSPWKPLVKG